MTWNYRQGGSWNSATIKKREGGQWVTIGGSNGGGGEGSSEVGEQFYTTEPGRGAGNGATGADIVVPDDYSSIQNAIDNTSSGDRIWIDSSQGPYSEAILYDRGANHITIDGYNPDTNTRAVIQAPSASDHIFTTEAGGGNQRMMIQNNTEDFYETALAQPIEGNAGETKIQVQNASNLTCDVGDIIHFTEERIPYGDTSGMAGGVTGEFRIVEDIDTINDTVTVNYQMLLPYPNNNSNGIGNVESSLFAKDIQWYGLDVEGQGIGSGQDKVWYVNATREPWIENCRVHGADDNLIYVQESFRTHFEDVTVENTSSSGSNYGIASTYGTCSTYIKGVNAENLSRYAVRFGSNSTRPAVDAHVQDVYATNFAGDNQTIKSHYGGFFVTWKRIHSGVNSSLMRCASRNWTIDGLTDQDNGSSGEPMIICTRKNSNIVIRNTPDYVDGWDAPLPSGRDDNRIFRFAYDHTEYDEGAEDILIENLTIESDGTQDITNIGAFRWDDTVGSASIDSLTFHNVVYDGQQLQESHVESWTNYDAGRIGNLTVTHD